MLTRKISPFILCGGAGTRLWPLSREAFPKQFHQLTGNGTLFQQTCQRFENDLFGRVSVLSNHQHRFLIAEQLEEIGLSAANIVLEPVSRNTAPASCVAVLMAARTDPDNLVLLVPADHVIADVVAFARAIEQGIGAADDGALVTFGVKPDCPHTGYGYIESENGDSQVLNTKRFVEKPSRQVAEKFLDSGAFYWNAGIVLCRAATLVSLFENYAPTILTACRRAIDEATKDLGFLRLSAAYADAPAISLDYAITEKVDNLRCVPLNTPWSDVGSWSAMWSALEKDGDGNVVFGDGEVLLEETSNCLVYSDQACIALAGLKDVVVVATVDAVLVASKDRAEHVKSIVERLRDNPRTFVHTRVYRPWGWYQMLERGERYQVKCIMVKAGGRLSLQSHLHRSEHWVVVKGTLEVTKGDSVELLSENQSTYIPIGETHRLANPGKIPAFLIEVQSGAYLGEDDIFRLEDVYGRSSRE